MDFEWDERKRLHNLEKHGVDFVAMLDGFDERPALEWRDSRRSYGEARYNRLVFIQDVLFHITFTRRSGSIRLISARRANRREHKAYYQSGRE